MSKRATGDFPRIEKDFYPTPFKAVLPLIPYLRRDGIQTFAEPGCGDGDLIRHLRSFGLSCVSRGDIRFGQDALQLTVADLNDAQAIISNLPFEYPEARSKLPRLMLDLMRHFLHLDVLSYLLLPHDFLTNEYAAPFMKRCSDIIVVGRLKWIANSEHDSGFDNSVWGRFDAQHRGNTAFHNDRSMAEAAE